MSIVFISLSRFHFLLQALIYAPLLPFKLMTSSVIIVVGGGGGMCVFQYNLLIPFNIFHLHMHLGLPSQRWVTYQTALLKDN